MLTYRVACIFMDTEGCLHMEEYIIEAVSNGDANKQTLEEVTRVQSRNDWVLVNCLIVERLDTRS